MSRYGTITRSGIFNTAWSPSQGAHGRRGNASRYLISSSRLYLPVGGSSALPGINSSQYAGGCMMQQTPPWDCVSPRLGWGGFTGVSSIGEVALTNNYIIEAAGIEINGTKYWFSFDGSNSYTTTTPSGSDGVHNATVVAGSYKWSDPNTLVIPASSLVRLIWAVNSGGASNYIPYGGTGGPLPQTYWQTSGGRGDYASINTASSRIAAISANTTTGSSNTFGSWLAPPMAFIAKPVSIGGPAVVIGGMSIDAGANDFNNQSGATSSDGLNFGGYMRGLFRGTPVPALNWAIPGTKSMDMLLAQTPAAGVRGWDMRDAMMASVGYPWSTAIIGGPVNDVTSGAAYTSALQAVATAFKARGNRRVVMTTERPLSTLTEQATGTANGYLLTGGDTHQRVVGTGKQDRNTRILAIPSPLDAVIDMRAATDSGVTISAAETAKWRSDGPATTFSASAALGQKVFSVPAGIILQGDHVALSPKLATGSSERIYVDTVVNAGATDTITAKSNLAFSYGSGEAVQVIYGETSDSVHTSRLGSVAEAAIINAAKGSAIL